MLKTKSLLEIYEKCSFEVNKPCCYEEVSMQIKWNKGSWLWLTKNDIWELISIMKNKCMIGIKWVYRTRLYLDDSIYKHKTLLILNKYS